jgi:hypothetical protein
LTRQQNGAQQSGSLVDDKAGQARAALDERRSLDLHDISDLPRGCYAWVHSEDPRFQFGAPDRGAIPQGRGDYEDLAKILFQFNGYRPGRVRGWYVIVRTDAGRGWAVGQLCADAFTPVQVFEDMVYPSEAEARARATSLRSNNPGLIRRDNRPNGAMEGDYEEISPPKATRKRTPTAGS